MNTRENTAAYEAITLEIERVLGSMTHKPRSKEALMGNEKHAQELLRLAQELSKVFN